MAPKSKTPSFKDAHCYAFLSIAAVYRLVQFQQPSLDSVEDDERFRECVADLEENIKGFQNVYQTVKPQLVKAKPRPKAVKVCGKHGIYSFDLVSEICEDILRKTTLLVGGDGCLQEWQNAIRGSVPVFIVPPLDELEHLNAMLQSEAVWVEAQQPGGGGGKAKQKPRGRKKATYQVVQREAEIAADWEQARNAGTYKPDFAREHKMKPAELDLLLGRVRKRKNRAE